VWFRFARCRASRRRGRTLQHEVPQPSQLSRSHSLDVIAADEIVREDRELRIGREVAPCDELIIT